MPISVMVSVGILSAQMGGRAIWPVPLTFVCVMAMGGTRGMTVADWWRVTKRAPNATFMGDVDADGFFALLTERLARL